jgi:Fungal protein kinase
MSGKVLEGKVPHTYLDDLESFYYVLCWILTIYTAPHKARCKPRGIASWWDNSMSYQMKIGQIASYSFDLPLEPWFGPCFQKLASSLHKFFHVRRPSMGDLAPPVDPAKDYDEYLGYIRQCILDMDAEDMAATRRPPSPSDPSECSRSSSSNDLDNESEIKPEHLAS